jgi:hypothetical protein
VGEWRLFHWNIVPRGLRCPFSRSRLRPLFHWNIGQPASWHRIELRRVDLAPLPQAHRIRQRCKPSPIGVVHHRPRLAEYGHVKRQRFAVYNNLELTAAQQIPGGRDHQLSKQTRCDVRQLNSGRPMPQPRSDTPAAPLRRPNPPRCHRNPDWRIDDSAGCVVVVGHPTTVGHTIHTANAVAPW